MILLESPNLILLPYDGESDWEKLSAWYYDKKYQNFWRHHTRPYRPQDFKNYAQSLVGDVFTIRAKDTKEIVGLAQVIPDTKTSRSCFAGLIIDEKYQGRRYPLEAYIVLFNYCFNRIGFRKVIVEFLESHKSLQKIVTENGFLYEGKLIGECFMDGQFVNELRYCMFDTYYNKKFKPILEGW